MSSTQITAYLASKVVPGVRRYNGQVPVDADIVQMAHDLDTTVMSVIESLWTLQKQGVVTFRERKGAKGNSVISRIRISEQALNGAAKPKPMTLVAAFDVLDVVEDINEAKAKSDEALIEYPTIPCTHRKVAPQWCVAHESNWPRGDRVCTAEWERQNPEPGEKVADFVEGVGAYPDDLVAVLVPPALEDFPQMRGVLWAQRVREATVKASETLAEAGLDDLALTVLDNGPAMSDLDAEVLRIAVVLGWSVE